MTHPDTSLVFVCAVSNWATAQSCLLRSPCIQSGRWPLLMQQNTRSAAELMNRALQTTQKGHWVIWVHQDVYLPEGWDEQFLQSVKHAQALWSNLAVAGVYGIRGTGAQTVRLGHVLDRGVELKEPQGLPALADSLDELCFGIQAGTSIALDPRLKFDFYATDAVLEAQAQGLCAAVIEAYCEHWSNTPSQGRAPQALLSRISESAVIFEHKWQHRLPITTPCFPVDRVGSTADFLIAASQLPDQLAPAARPHAPQHQREWHIAHVLTGPGGDAETSEEFADGIQKLKSHVGPDTSWTEVPSLDWSQEFQARFSTAADDALVLLLRHPQLLIPAGTLSQLVQALHAAKGQWVAVPCRPLAGHPAPDYCTLRGLERYAAQLVGESVLVTPELPTCGDALVILTTAGALRAGALQSVGSWACGCYVHDFGHYHQGQAARSDMLDFIEPTVRKVLDIGGGEGHFLGLVKERSPWCSTHLSEYSHQVAHQARARVDHVWPGDFQALNFGGTDQRATFDCITMLDSLEHCTNPQAWLTKARDLLKPGGSLVLSVPNVGHWSVMADLLEGHWDYCPVGIHCNTHLRFFTRHSLIELLHQVGFTVERCENVEVPCPPAWRELWRQTPKLNVEPESWDHYAFRVLARNPRTEP